MKQCSILIQAPFCVTLVDNDSVHLIRALILQCKLTKLNFVRE